MDVTSSNFKTVLDRLDSELQNSLFLAIDTEFTGLEDGFRTCTLDTPSERYHKIRNGSMKFLVVQFGLSIFSYHKETKQYEYRTYNFYIFPPTKSLPGFSDCRFLSQASSIGFLVSQGFDFNKLFKEGIPYLNIVEEENLKSKVEEKMKYLESPSVANNRPTTIPIEQKEFVQSTLSKIEAFLQSDEETLILENCNAFQRKLIFSHGRPKFPDASFQSKTNEKHERVMVITKATPEQHLKQKEDNYKLDLEEVDKLVGFSKVMKKITQSGKLVVGHNMLLDICHIINQFYAELPEDYEEFKTIALSVFPKLIDTKTMASTQPFRDRFPNSALEPLLVSLSSAPFKIGKVAPAENFPTYSLDDKKCHEAGYDAFMTGLCFIGMFDFLKELSDSSKDMDLLEAPFMQPFVHKLHLMRVNDIPYMDLAAPDLEPSRDHIFHLSFPKEWKTPDIIQLFSDYGPVLVSWINDSSAFVTLFRKENKHLVIKNLTLPSGCTIMTYEQSLKAKVNSSTSLSVVDAVEKRSFPSPAVPVSNKRVRLDSDNADAPVSKNVPFSVPDQWD